MAEINFRFFFEKSVSFVMKKAKSKRLFRDTIVTGTEQTTASNFYGLLVFAELVVARWRWPFPSKQQLIHLPLTAIFHFLEKAFSESPLTYRVTNWPYIYCFCYSFTLFNCLLFSFLQSAVPLLFSIFVYFSQLNIYKTSLHLNFAK